MFSSLSLSFLAKRGIPLRSRLEAGEILCFAQNDRRDKQVMKSVKGLRTSLVRHYFLRNNSHSLFFRGPRAADRSTETLARYRREDRPAPGVSYFTHGFRQRTG